MSPDERARLAAQLGWTVGETRSFSLHALRELASAKLAAVISRTISSGQVVVDEEARVPLCDFHEAMEIGEGFEPT